MAWAEGIAPKEYVHLRHTALTRRIDPRSRFEAGGPDLWATEVPHDVTQLPQDGATGSGFRPRGPLTETKTKKTLDFSLDGPFPTFR